MINMPHTTCETTEPFDLAQHAVDSGYFLHQIQRYEDKYRSQFESGWGQFFAAYSKGKLANDNMDYDEWAFLCEHFLEELTQACPPGDCDGTQERPEATSGLSIWESKFCLTRNNISGMLSGRCLAANDGLKLLNPLI